MLIVVNACAFVLIVTICCMIYARWKKNQRKPQQKVVAMPDNDKFRKPTRGEGSTRGEGTGTTRGENEREVTRKPTRKGEKGEKERHRRKEGEPETRSTQKRKDKDKKSGKKDKPRKSATKVAA